MAISSTSFSSTYQPSNKGVRRRGVTESITKGFLVKHGLELLEILLDCALNHPDLEAKARAADRLLKHLFLHPKAGETSQDEHNKVSVALLDFMKALHGKIPPETVDLMLNALKELEEKTAREAEQTSDEFC